MTILLSLGGHLILSSRMKRPGLTDHVKCLGQVDEGEEQGTPLFAALVLQLRKGEHHVDC